CFFQAEDGIRDFHVTGVQTCALPIFSVVLPPPDGPTSATLRIAAGLSATGTAVPVAEEFDLSATAFSLASRSRCGAGPHAPHESTIPRCDAEHKGADQACQDDQCRISTATTGPSSVMRWYCGYLRRNSA